MKQIIVATSILLLLLSCTITGQTTLETENIPIGGLFSLTGDGASWGGDELKAVQLVIDETNEEGGIDRKQIDFVFEDAKTTSRDAVTAYNALKSKADVTVVIGSTWEQTTEPIAPLAEQDQIVLISPSISGVIEDDKNYNYLFTTWYSELSGTKRVLQEMNKQNIGRAVIIHNTGIWPTFVSNLFEKHSEEYNIEVLQAKEMKPDAIYTGFSLDEYLQSFMKQAQELGLTVPIYSASATENELLLEWYGQYKYGVYHPVPKITERHTEFIAKYKAKYGEEPTSPSAAPAYDAAKLVIAALKDGARTGEEIKNWLDNVQDFPGTVVEKITFDEKGLLDVGTDAFVIRTVKNRTFKDI
ncbi:hypothetical protein COV18_03890 [Candidatus Woesearchaeota archaeon CG10_big_fil_rev_8_21_14_0_10_37_12]|nr:MAG: hypothetical protein COV18_03890 [Candidatus Woesearchaeota archaeon CG10_big_fil_rev_8_21_14_0_10_37_12]